MDPLAALLVGAFVLKTAAATVRLSVRELMDAALSKEQVLMLGAAARAVAGVKGVSAVRTRRTGTQRQGELEIGVEPDLAMESAERIAVDVQQAVLTTLNPGDEVRVLIATAEPEVGRRDEVAAAVHGILQAQVHRFRSRRC